VVRQLRGDLADSGRQVEGAKTGLVDTLGGDGTIANLVLQAGW
jgi:acetyl-CoA C-acetyltransferase/acetyl-CoA acyltransferase